jgi:ribonuclease P protein component
LKKFSLSKKERLKSAKSLTRLFKEGKSFSVFPLRVYYLDVAEIEERDGIKCAFSVPKRLFKKAVNRNRLKRQMREAYRLNKSDLHILSIERPLDIILIYYGAEPLAYTSIEQATQRILLRLGKELSSRHE